MLVQKSYIAFSGQMIVRIGQALTANSRNNN